MPGVDAIAARDAQGKTWLAITHLDPNRTAQVSIAVAGGKFKRARGETLAAPRVDSVNTFEAPKTVVPRAVQAQASGGALKLSLPPASVTVVALE